jgi:hypothetical protein
MSGWVVVLAIGYLALGVAVGISIDRYVIRRSAFKSGFLAGYQKGFRKGYALGRGERTETLYQRALAVINHPRGDAA